MYFLFVSTFAVGMFAGAYLYVTAFAPTYESGIRTGENIGEDVLVIEGEMYGGCSENSACATFRIVDGRHYDFLSSPGIPLEKGMLPVSKRSGLLQALDRARLEQGSVPIENNSCSSYADGIDYAYIISFEGETYELDTCSTAFAYDEALQLIMLDLWYQMENPDEESSEGFEGNPVDIFWDRFHNPPQ